MLRKAKKVRKVKRGRKAKSAAFLVTEQSIRKMTYGRLVNLFKMYAPPEPTNFPVSMFFDDLTGRNRLQRMRKAYGFSMGQVAEKMKVSYKTIYNTEIARSLPQATIDEYIDALMRLQRLGDTTETGLSFPKPTQKKPRAAAAGSYMQPATDEEVAEEFEDGSEFETDEFGYEEEEEDEDAPF